MATPSSRRLFGLRLPAIAAAVALVISGLMLSPAAYADEDPPAPSVAQEESVPGVGATPDEAVEDSTASGRETPPTGGTDVSAPDEEVGEEIGVPDTADEPTADDPDRTVPVDPNADGRDPRAGTPETPATSDGGLLTDAGATLTEKEPNNSTAQAQTLPLGDTVNAKFGPAGTCDNDFYDCDVYRISTPQAGRLRLDLRFASTLGTDGSFGLSVLNAAGQRTHEVDIRASDYNGSRLRGLFISVDKGTSYISIKARVQSFGGTPIWSGQGYTLKATVEPLNVETERNSSTATADLIGLGTRVYGATFDGDCNNDFYDCDYYRVSLPSSARLAVDFRASCSLATERPYRVSVYDNAGRELRTAELGGPDCSGAPFTVTAPAGNVYLLVYARAQSFAGQTVAFGKPYSFTIGRKLSTATPTISGTPKVGSTLAAKPGKWGPGSVTFKYQWKRDGKAITGATKSKYRLSAADAGRSVTVTVTGSRSGYNAESRTSAKKYVPTAFVDVPRSHRFYTEIQWMYDSGATTGVKTSQGLKYQPKGKVTREAMAAFLYRQNAPKGYQPKKQHFADVPKSHKFYREIEWMYDSGLSTGIKQGGARVYKPKDGVSREAMAAFMYRLLSPENGKAPTKAPFIDVPKNHKFGKEIAWMKASGLSTGTRTARGAAYKPKDTVSREAMAAFLYRAK
jgi:hypothetical protein